MAGLETVPVRITETESEAAFLRLACERNAQHGYQLTTADKQRMARRMYSAAGDIEQKKLKEELPNILSVTPRTIQSWVSQNRQGRPQDSILPTLERPQVSRDRQSTPFVTCCESGGAEDGTV